MFCTGSHAVIGGFIGRLPLPPVFRASPVVCMLHWVRHYGRFLPAGAWPVVINLDFHAVKALVVIICCLLLVVFPCHRGLGNFCLVLILPSCIWVLSGALRLLRVCTWPLCAWRMAWGLGVTLFNGQFHGARSPFDPSLHGRPHSGAPRMDGFYLTPTFPPSTPDPLTPLPLHPLPPQPVRAVYHFFRTIVFVCGLWFWVRTCVSFPQCLR